MYWNKSKQIKPGFPGYRLMQHILLHRCTTCFGHTTIIKACSYIHICFMLWCFDLITTRHIQETKFISLILPVEHEAYMSVTASPDDGRMTETWSAAKKIIRCVRRYPGKPGLICFDLITTQQMQATNCISLILKLVVCILLRVPNQSSISLMLEYA
jgi:hypothetical protein